jgi:ERCC4-type nuclease
MSDDNHTPENAAVIRSCELIIDKGRERAVSRHCSDFVGIRWSEKTITTGDYAILSPTGRLLTIVERKTLDDYGASIKDGRHANKQKLIAARTQTGCRIIYIVEGKDPVTSKDPTGSKSRCGGIPWSTIESSMVHLSLRDDISHYRTRDSIHTAQLLTTMVKYYDSLLGVGHDLPAPSPHMSGGSEVTADNTADELPATHELLALRHEKTTHQIAREMWACFQGISAESADEYISNWSMRQVVLGEIPREELTNFRLPSGRRPSKVALNSITGVTRALESRILRVVPQISAVTASEITSKYTLKEFLLLSAEDMSAIKIGKAQRALGLIRANKIHECFNYCTKTQAAS